MNNELHNFCHQIYSFLNTGRESICEGGEVVFNTSHQNFFHSLLVEELWICNDVCIDYKCFKKYIFIYILFYSTISARV